ncbi:hypothetical protein [Duganella sp. CF458]|uniref:hypothetical protein n=1 Tax=Duganella sp. CF458 TaxID=1884368 RepID=UPI0011133BC3|nr:hypothetical protein [Duganella sp. CF458]
MPAETTNANNLFEFAKIGIQLVGYGVTWGIVFRGWKVSNEQNAKRDDRKELRDLVNDIADSIRNVEADVVSYLTSTEGKSASYWTVHFGVRQVNASIVGSKIFNTKPINDLLIAYRQAVTDKALQGPDSPALTGHQLSSALRGVSSAGTSLIRGIETRYREIYPLAA